MFTVMTWLWGDRYHRVYVERLMAGFKRHMRSDYRFVIMSDAYNWGRLPIGCEAYQIPRSVVPLTFEKGCLSRLIMFDPEFQELHGIRGKLISIDLDTVITGPLDPVFDRPEPFVILQGVNSRNPCPYNGSLMLITPGVHPEVWSEFSVEASKAAPYDEFPDDQAWIAHKVPGAAGWLPGNESGVYAFAKPGWPPYSLEVPHGARIVTFPGKRDPSQYMNLNWIRKHWRE